MKLSICRRPDAPMVAGNSLVSASASAGRADGGGTAQQNRQIEHGLIRHDRADFRRSGLQGRGLCRNTHRLRHRADGQADVEIHYSGRTDIDRLLRKHFEAALGYRDAVPSGGHTGDRVEPVSAGARLECRPGIEARQNYRGFRNGPSGWVRNTPRDASKV